MRIAEIAPLTIPIPPRDYGGTERVIANVVEGLVNLGHEVTLFASGDSCTHARLSAPVPRALAYDTSGSQVDALAYHLALLAGVYRRADEFDVIHAHLDYLALPFAATSPTPTVTTLHGRLETSGLDVLLPMYPGANFVSISHSQRRPLSSLHFVANVYHGVDVQTFPFQRKPDDYLAFVGRISPEKGPEHAIEIAKRAGMKLKIAAKIDPVDRDYYEREVKPLMAHPLIEFLGPLCEAPKRELLAHAVALLAPIMWSEPFGMVFAEAMACGTPVLTRPRGSAPEVIEEGVSGLLRMEDDDLAAAVHEVGALDRAGIRDYAQRRFDMRRMATDYANVFRLVLDENEARGPAARVAMHL